jgi:formylglycine-generating enzyme required for sulfatase activity
VSLVTDPPDAEVSVFRYEERRRRLVPVEQGLRGETPLDEVPLPMGSYLLRIEAEGCLPVRYPVLVGRLQHWDGVRPGDARPTPIRLPRVGELEPDDCYVPAGRFWSEASNEAISDPYPRRFLWCDAFVAKRDPVTNGEYVAWLNTLPADEALVRVPRTRAGVPIYGRDPDGRWVLGEDEQGHAWLPDMPVVGVDHAAAVAHAAWRGWRLPWELEWEKAARGVDGRVYPWGNQVDPTWAWMRDSWAGAPPGPRPVGDHPVDTSPYGLRGAAGNVADWTADCRPGTPEVEADRVLRRSTEGKLLTQRGGSWLTSAFPCRLDFRRVAQPLERAHYLGFRLFRSFGEGDGAG